jgi:hypothetical protein
MKNINIGNRTRDLPACSAVPQPTAILPPLFPSVNSRKILYAFLASTLRANGPVTLFLEFICWIYFDCYYALHILRIKTAPQLNRMPEK